MISTRLYDQYYLRTPSESEKELNYINGENSKYIIKIKKLKTEDKTFFLHVKATIFLGAQA